MSQLQQPAAKLPTGLAALVALQRTASATTPDGAPTVAAQMAQKAKAQMQGQGQPPQGIGQEAPPMEGQSVQATAQQAGIAGQIGQQQQQQAQQAMMQMAQAQTPKPEGPLQLARGGIAALPADNMHNMGRYARGGVIGFDGETGSDVPKSRKMTDEEQAKADSIALGSKGYDSKIGNTAEDLAKISELLVNSGKANPVNGLSYNPVAAQIGNALIERGGVDKPSGLEQFTPEQRNELAKKAMAGVEQTADAKLKNGSNVPARQPAQPAQSVQQSQAAQIAALEKPNTMQTFTELQNLIQGPDNSKSDALEEERTKLTSERNGMLNEKIAAMREGTASRQALEKERQENLQGQKLRAWLQGMSENYRGKGGEAVGAVTADDFRTRQLMAQADAADKLAITKERESDLAARVGDKDHQITANREAQAAQAAHKKLIAETFDHVITSKTNLYAADARILENQFTNAAAKERQIMSDKAAMAREMFSHPDILLAENLAKELAGPGKTPTAEQRVAANMKVAQANPAYQKALLDDNTRQAAARTAAFRQITEAKKAFALSSIARTLKAGSPEYKQALRDYLMENQTEAMDLLGQTPQGGAAAPAAAAPSIRNFSDLGKK